MKTKILSARISDKGKSILPITLIPTQTRNMEFDPQKNLPPPEKAAVP